MPKAKPAPKPKRKPPKRTPPPTRRQLRPRAKPQAPEAEVRWVHLPPASGVRVDELSMLRVDTAYACVRYISESLAALECPAYRYRPDGGKDYDGRSVVDWLLNTQANPEMSAQTWRAVALAHSLTAGNHVSEIEQDILGRPVWLWPLTPDRVCAERVGADTVAEYGLGADGVRAGDIAYRVENPRGDPTYLPARRVFHLKGPSWDGILGLNLARLAGEALGLSLAAEQFAATFFGNGATPGGVLTTDQLLGKEAAERLAASWKQSHGGPRRQRGIAVLEQNLRFQAVGSDPEKGQLVPSRQFTVETVCRFFGVPPTKVGHMARASYASVEQTAREAVMDCLRPWARRFEAEVLIKLFGRNQRGVMAARHDFGDMLKGDTAAMTSHAVAMLEHGVWDVDTALQYFDLNPIGKAAGGKLRLVPLNFQTLENAAQTPPEPPKTPRNAPESGQNGSTMAQDRTNSQLFAAHLPLFLEAFGRCQGRARQRAADAFKRLGGDKDRFSAWLDDFLAGHDAYAAKALLAPARALASLAGGLDADAALAPFLARYRAELRAALAAAFDAGRPPELNGEAESAARAARLCLPAHAGVA